MNERGSIEEAFKSAFDGHKVAVDAGVWGAVKSQIGASATSGLVANSLFLKASAIIGGIGLIGLATFTEVQYHQAASNPLNKVEVMPVVPASAVEAEAASFESVESKSTMEHAGNSVEEPQTIADQTPEKAPAVQATTETKTASEPATLPASEPANGQAATAAAEPIATESAMNANRAKISPDPQTEPSAGSEIEAPTVEPEMEVEEPALSSATVDYQREVHLTPNGDWNNDELTISSSDIAQISVVIFNRAGKEVFRAQSPEFKWDGRDRSGQLVPRGTYFSFITATGNDGKPVSEQPMKTTIYVNY